MDKHITPTPWANSGKIIYGSTPEDGQIGGAHDSADAEFICKAVNNHDRLTAEVGRLRDVLHSIHLRAELAEADGVHMRGALGNIKDDAAKALNPEEPK